MRSHALGASRTAVAVVALLSSSASAVQLYSVDFSSPPHVVDTRPEVGTGAIPRQLPTSIWGTPLVQPTSAGLEAQPLRLSGYASDPFFDADGVTFLVSDLSPYTRLAFNLEFSVEAVETDTGSMLISFGISQYITFRWAFQTGAETNITSQGTTTNIGPWNAEEPMHLRVVFDSAQQQWWILQDYELVFTGAWVSVPPQYLQIETRGKASAALDNVVINGEFSIIPVDGASWGQIKSLYR